MRQPRVVAMVASRVLAAAVAISASAQPAGAPGVLNYIEGQALINGLSLAEGSAGIARLVAGETLTTQQKGKVEVLLTPGTFLRVGGNGSVSLIALDPASTEILLEKGRATLEATEIPSGRLVVNLAGSTVRILEPGLYDLDAKRKQVHVFDGHAIISSFGSGVDLIAGHWVDLTPGDSLLLNKFDEESFRQDDLYQWTSLRSAYLAEASANLAANYAANYAQGNFDAMSGGGAGWCWDATYDVFTFIPVGGIRYSPFGWGFYSPRVVYQTPPVAHRPDKWVPGHHHFDPDPNRWGPGFHYPIPARTVPVPASVTPPAVVRPAPRVPQPGGPQQIGGFRPAPAQPAPICDAQMRTSAPPRAPVTAPAHAPGNTFRPALPAVTHVSAPPAPPRSNGGGGKKN